MRHRAKGLASATLLLGVSASGAEPQTMTITRSGSQPASPGPPQYFTGSARVEPVFPALDPSRLSASIVTFEPGARSAWHTHPLGQTLVVTSGTGWIQQQGREKHQISAGDVVWTPPGVKHWHGATSTDRMTHVSILEQVDGKNVEWMEKVTDDQYLAGETTVAPGAVGVTAPEAANVRRVAPALERYTQRTLLGDLWKRPDLSPRDRSLVTVAALIARNLAIEMPDHFRLALDNGVRPSELSELITHLAFYSGWANAMSAVAVAEDVFTERKIGPDQLPPASGELLPLDQAAEARRAAVVDQSAGPVAPGLVHYTSNVLFRDLWLRPALSPRDRSLVTVSALIASGQVAQIPFHLNRAMDNGLTKAEASEVLTHLAFYAGWPNVFSAVPVAGEVFEKRPR